MNVAVIPARGGSKRIPRKNVKDFCGRPVIAYSIDAARHSGLFERIIVSTEDEEIASVARQHGAEVPFARPDALADDHAGTLEVMAHAVAQLKSDGVNPTAICCIYATAPFVRGEDMAAGLTLLESGNWKFVFSAGRFASPVFRAFKRTVTGGVEMFFPEHFRTRSQDLPEALHDAGQFYWGRPDAWLEGASIFDIRSTVVMIPDWLVHDIDTEDDWTRAEIVWKALCCTGARA